MTTLHLGINDLPYVDYDAPPKKVAKAKRGKANKPRKTKGGGGQTTGEIAEILEAKYHIMETFAERHLPEIAGSLAESMAGALESLMMGAPASQSPFGEATDEIKAKFQKFLDDKEMDGATGVPTQAAKDGVNHRLKLKRGPPRPSFIDTGQYQAHFQNWIDDA